MKPTNLPSLNHLRAIAAPEGAKPFHVGIIIGPGWSRWSSITARAQSTVSRPARPDPGLHIEGRSEFLRFRLGLSRRQPDDGSPASAPTLPAILARFPESGLAKSTNFAHRLSSVDLTVGSPLLGEAAIRRANGKRRLCLITGRSDVRADRLRNGSFQGRRGFYR